MNRFGEGTVSDRKKTEEEGSKKFKICDFELTNKPRFWQSSITVAVISHSDNNEIAGRFSSAQLRFQTKGGGLV